MRQTAPFGDFLQTEKKSIESSLSPRVIELSHQANQADNGKLFGHLNAAPSIRQAQGLGCPLTELLFTWPITIRPLCKDWQRWPCRGILPFARFYKETFITRYLETSKQICDNIAILIKNNLEDPIWLN